jgi:hypothetical protein
MIRFDGSTRRDAYLVVTRWGTPSMYRETSSITQKVSTENDRVVARRRTKQPLKSRAKFSPI